MLQHSLASLLRNTPHFRGKPRLATRLLPHNGTRAATVFGLNVELDLADVIQRDIYSGLYEPFETRWVKSFLGPGMTFVDVGANVGYYTWLAASLVEPSGRVLAFEPDAYVYGKLEAVVAANHLSCVACRKACLSDREGFLTLYVPPDSYGNRNSSVVPYCEGMTAVSVPATTLDHVFEIEGLSRIDLLKVDVEGHEVAVLKGAESIVRAGAVRAILCEFNPDYAAGAGFSTAQLEAWFSEHNFEFVRRFPSKWGPVFNKLFFYRGGH